MSTETAVIVYGGGAVFKEIFNAVAAVMGGPAYERLIKLALLLGGLWTVVNSSIKRDWTHHVKYMGLYVLVFYALFLPKATVHIIDRTQGNQHYAVDNVPAGLALAAHWTSLIGDGLTQLMEANFSLPDDLQYHQSGMVMASKLVTAAGRFQVQNDAMNQTLNHFMQQCVFYDLYLHKYSLDTLVHHPDVWGFLREHASPARAFPYQGQIVTCQEGASKLAHAMPNMVDQATRAHGRHLFPGARDGREALLSHLPLSYQYLANISQSGTQIVRNALVNNALQNAVQQNNLRFNNPAAAYAFTKAQEHKRQTNWTMGQMAAHWLPLMKTTFEALMYGAFIIVFLLTLLPIGATVFKNYLYSLLWLQTWAPLYAILNLVVSFYARQSSLAGLDAHQLSLASQNQLSQLNSDMASLAGYLSMSIPFMAGGLVQGMATTLNRMAQYIGGVTQSAATGAAGEAASGNLSLGNLSYNNANVQNSTGFHWDTNARVMTGQTSAELPGGATVSATADGHTLMNTQGAMSQLGTSINVAESVRTSATHQSEQAESAAYNLARAATDSASVAYRDLDELGAQQSQNQSSGQSDSLTQHGGLNEAANTLHQYAEEFANNHNFHHSQASQILGAVSGEGSIGIDKSGAISKIENLLGSFKLNGGGRGEWSYSRRGEAQQLYNEAKQYIEKHDLNTTFEHAVKAAHEGNYRVQDDESGRLAKQVSSSLDQAVSQREEAQSQFNLAENYRDLAQWAEENATSINANASQAFMDWLQHQPNPNGQGTLGPRTAEAMIAHDPELAQHYAQQYLQETTSTYMKQSEQKAGITPEQVESAGTVFDQQVKHHQADMQQRHHQQQHAIDRMAEHVDVGNVDNQHQLDAQDVSHSAEHQLQTKRDLLDTANHEVKGKVEDENADNTAH